MPSDQQHQPDLSGPNRNRARLQILLPVIVAIAGAAIAFWLLQTGPKAKPRQKARNAVLVDVRPVEFGQQTTTISVTGTVKPKHIVELKPEVSGKIIAMSEQLVPGEHFGKDQTLLNIDPRDYQLAAQQLSSEVAKAEADLQMELGRQRVARKEYELLGEKVDSEELNLMLRVPQLDSSRATLEGVKTKLEKALLDLARTTVKAPFNAVVMSRQVNLGTSVSTSTTLATLVGTDSYWVEAPIPVSLLKWINFNNREPGENSSARIFDASAWGPDRYRSGKVAGLTAQVEEQGRMAEALVEISDPLALKDQSAGGPKLLLGSYVRVEIEGSPVSRAAVIERELIRDGNRVWVMDGNGQLDIRPVDIAFRAHDHVLVTGGLQEGENLVVSNLPSPVQGMALRLADSDSQPGSAGAARQP